MKRLLSLFIFISLILTLSSTITTAQGKFGTIGKTFSKNEAKILFGKVMGSLKVEKALVEKALARADNYVLFAIKHSRVYILGENKFSLTDKNFALGKEEVAYMFSTSVVKEFLDKTKGKYLTFELRYNRPVNSLNKSGELSTTSDETGSIIFTVTGDEETLEMSFICPPICPI